MNQSVSKLSNNQKRVITGLCLYPMESDSYISEKCGVKRSTFAIVKKRLVSGQEALLHAVNIPNFVKLGATLFSIGYSRTAAYNFSKIDRSEISNRLNAFPNLVHTFVATNKGFAFLISKHFTDFMLAHQAVAYYYLEHEYIQMSNMRTFHLSTDDNGVIKLMEHGESLSRFFGLDLVGTHDSRDFFSLQKGDDNLIQSISPLGWQIFDALMRYPSFSIVEIADLLKKPRNTITRWIRKLQRADLYQTKYIPDLVKLGLNIKVVMFLSIFTLERENDRESLVKNIINYFNPSMLLVGRSNVCFFANFADYTMVKEAERKFWAVLNDQDLSVSLMDKFYLANRNMVFTKNISQSLKEILSYLRDPQKYSIRPYSKVSKSDENRSKGEMR